MKREAIQMRGMVKYIILSLVTGGIYRLYFFYKLSLDVDALCEGDGEEPGNYIISMILSTVTLGLYSIYWEYKLAQRMHVNAPRYGYKMMECGKDIVVMDALGLGLIAAWELIKNANRMAIVYNASLDNVPAMGGVR